jgi:hypothetical protein
MRMPSAPRWLTTRSWQRFRVWKNGDRKGKPGGEGEAPKEIPDTAAFSTSQAEMAGSSASPPVAEAGASEGVGGWLATRRDLEARGWIAAITGAWGSTTAWCAPDTKWRQRWVYMRASRALCGCVVLVAQASLHGRSFQGRSGRGRDQKQLMLSYPSHPCFCPLFL